MEFVLFGGGGHARSVADALRRAGHGVVAVVDPKGATQVHALVVDSDEDGVRHARARGCPVVVAVGDNRRRLALAHRLMQAGLELPSFVAGTATLAGNADLGAGVVALEHAHIGPGSRIGDAAVVNTAAIVEHDVWLGDGCHVASGAVLSGGVHAGSGVVIGAGAAVIPGVSIGDWSIVGAGSVVVRDVAAGSVVVGVPARLLRSEYAGEEDLK